MTFPVESGERWTQYLGDCLEVMPTLPAQSVDLIAADLPYGTTACSWDSVIPFAPLWEAYRHVLKPNSVVVLTASQPFTSALVMSNPKWFRYEWIWKKHRATGHLDCKRRPLKEHESVLVFSETQHFYNPQMQKGNLHKRGGTRTGPAHVWGKFSDRVVTSASEYYPKSILDIGGVQIPDHPTQKPVALFAYLIRTYTNPGDTVLDNTSGSATTGVAALQELRNYIGIERDETYYRASVERLRCAARQEVMAL